MLPIQLSRCSAMDVNDDIKSLLPRRLIFGTTSDDIIPLPLLCSETSDDVDLQPLPFPLPLPLTRHDTWHALHEDATAEQHQQHWDIYLNRNNQLYVITDDDDEPIPPPPLLVRQ